MLFKVITSSDGTITRTRIDFPLYKSDDVSTVVQQMVTEGLIDERYQEDIVNQLIDMRKVLRAYLPYISVLAHLMYSVLTTLPRYSVLTHPKVLRTNPS